MKKYTIHFFILINTLFLLTSCNIYRGLNEISQKSSDERLFAPIIYAYRDYEQSEFTSFDENIIGDSLLVQDNGISYNTGWNNNYDLYYSFYDINNDGTYELIIGANKYITGIYSIQNGKPVSILQVEDRYTILLNVGIDNNIVISNSWGRMGYAAEFFYTINKFGSLMVLDTLFTLGDNKSGDEWSHFRAKEVNGEMIDITEEEYCMLIRKYGNYGYEPLEEINPTPNIELEWKLIADYEWIYDRSAKALLTKEETIESFFNKLYNSEELAYFNFIDSNTFYGYEYGFWINDKISNPWCLEYKYLSPSGEYYIFRIYEKVFHDGIFSHEVTGNFFAVSCQTGDTTERRCGYLHLYGVSQACAMIAIKRKENYELATIAGMLHDIYSYSSMDTKDHAHKGSILAKEILKSLEVFTEDEINKICSAIYNHSNKKEKHSSLDEVLIDADVLQHCLYNPLFEVMEHEKTRFENLKLEFGMI